MNSFKMKISVIYGILQMSIGIMIKLSNKIKSKKVVDAIF